MMLRGPPHQMQQQLQMGPAPDDYGPDPTQMIPKSDDSEKPIPIGARSAPPPIKFPKVHGLACLKFFDERFDPTLTGWCTQEEISILIWMLTNIKPHYACCHLDCKFWGELFKALGKGHTRKKDNCIIFS